MCGNIRSRCLSHKTLRLLCHATSDQEGDSMPRPRLFRPAYIAVVLVFIASGAYAAIPLGSTPHAGGVTFRVWAPYVDAVAIKMNDGMPVPMTKEPGHTDPGDTTWIGEVPGAKAGDRYKYSITYNGNTAEF